jgi:hypothetical protein
MYIPVHEIIYILKPRGSPTQCLTSTHQQSPVTSRSQSSLPKACRRCRTDDARSKLACGESAWVLSVVRMPGLFRRSQVRSHTSGSRMEIVDFFGPRYSNELIFEWRAPQNGVRRGEGFGFRERLKSDNSERPSSLILQHGLARLGALII